VACPQVLALKRSLSLPVALVAEERLDPAMGSASPDPPSPKER
jgi:hypothetical protein